MRSYFDKDSRIMYIGDDIDDKIVSSVNFDLLVLIHNDDVECEENPSFTRKPVKLYINSVGGNIYDMWSLIDIIDRSKTPIYTYCTGYALSAAFIIFIAGHKRFASKHATFMYHQISLTFGETLYNDLATRQQEADWLYAQYESYVTDRTKMTPSQLLTIRKEKLDYSFHIDEALELGVVDELI